MMKSGKFSENQSEASLECRKDFYTPLQDVLSVNPEVESYIEKKTDQILSGKRPSHTSQTQKSYIDSDLIPNQIGSERLDPMNFTHLQRTSGMILNEVPTNVKSVNDMKHKLQKNAHESNVDELPGFGKRNGNLSDPRSSLLSLKARHQFQETMKRISASTPNKEGLSSMNDLLQNENWKRLSKSLLHNRKNSVEKEKYKDDEETKTNENLYNKKSVTIEPPFHTKNREYSDNNELSVDITVVWLALNEECSAMNDPKVRRLYVAYSFLGRAGAELETPVSLPKPKCYVDKCHYHFKKTFKLHEADLPILGHLAMCRSPSKGQINRNDCIVFTVVSEPPEDPLGLDNCEDIGNAYLYFGDILACCEGDSYTEVLPVRTVQAEESVCGVLAVRIDGLDVVRRCLVIAERGFADV